MAQITIDLQWEHSLEKQFSLRDSPWLLQYLFSFCGNHFIFLAMENEILFYWICTNQNTNQQQYCYTNMV